MDKKPTYFAGLQNSKAVRSLALEHAIHQVFTAYESADLRCPFYFVDPVESKIRELDLYAEFHFDSGIQGGTAAIEFLVECKDLRGTHLVFSRVKPRWPHSEGAGHHTFTERQHDFQEELLKAFDTLESGYSIDFVRKQLEIISHNKELMKAANSRPFDYLPPAHECTAFRETRIKNEREADQSVLWNALLSLRNGKRVVQQKRRQGAKRLILPGIIQDAFFDRMLETYSLAMGNVALTYPIVVVDAELHVF